MCGISVPTCYLGFHATQKNPLKLSKVCELKIANIKKKCTPGGKHCRTAHRYVFLCKFGPLFLIKSIKKLLFRVKSVTSEGFSGIVLLAPALRKSWTDYGHSSPANTDVFFGRPFSPPKKFSSGEMRRLEIRLRSQATVFHKGSNQKRIKMFPFKNINQIDQNGWNFVLNRTRYQLNRVSDEQQQIRRQHSNNANRSLQQHGLLDGSKTQRQSRSQHDQSKHSGSRGHGMTSHPAQQV